MKKYMICGFFFFSVLHVCAQDSAIVVSYQCLPFGSIKPAGWIKNQMKKDMQGFVGNLDMLVPELMQDPIYAEGRLHSNSTVKDLGNNKEGDVGDDEQYKWWNSETQSNWWDGYMRNAMLLDDAEALAKIKQHVYAILATQDTDGYIGIYDTDLRYNFHGENGELWSKATLYRGLLAYYAYTHDLTVWNAVVKAVDNVMEHYPINNSDPFNVGENFSGGVAHGLTFTDVLDNMYQLSGDKKYWDYAYFLYMNFSDNYSSEKDVQLQNILDTTYTLQSHGVHTFEHLRPLIVATYASGNAQLQKALQIYIARIQQATTVAGGAIGDEWISGRDADATNTGYEYCSLQELLDSYTVLMQKSGSIRVGDEIENIFYNAAQGSRDPDHSAIAYLKTDNSYEMLGTKNGEAEEGKNQTRYKYSPAHQDVAVCCSPNAGRITPYFIQSAWLRNGDTTLIAALLGPNVLETKVNGIDVRIEIITSYPFGNQFKFKVSSYLPVTFALQIRKPAWVTTVNASEAYRTGDDYITITVQCNYEKSISLRYGADVIVKTDQHNDHYFTYGALVYAYPIPARMQTGREYAPGFFDITYAPENTTRYIFSEQHNAQFVNGKLYAELRNGTTNSTETVVLIPLAKTVLRQAAF